MKSNRESLDKVSALHNSKENSSKTKQITKVKTKSLKRSQDDAESESMDKKLNKMITAERGKARTTAASNATLEKTSKHVKHSGEKKVIKQATGYAEKRGTSTIYIPKSNALRRATLSPRPSHSTSLKVTTETRKTSKMSNSDKSKDKVVVHVKKKDKISGLDKNEEKVESKSRANKKKEAEIAEDDYEDDFESYESDFQECTDTEVSYMSDDESSELEPIEMKTEQKPLLKIVNNSAYKKVDEERGFDSGHYELAEARKRAARIESAIPNKLEMPKGNEEFKESTESSNSSNKDEKQVEVKSLPLSTDEGFEDERSGDFVKSIPIPQTSVTGIRKKEKEKKKSRSRGQELWAMIKLDVIEISLLECSPIPYEDFVRIFGKLDARQIAVQTKEDNLDVDVQTDDLDYGNKWTQFPVVCRTSLKTTNDLKQFQMEQVGVGGDCNDDLPPPPLYDILRLNEFLFRAGKVVLALLEKNILGGNILQNESTELFFSDGFVNLSTTSVLFLSERPVSFIRYSETSNKILMTIHASRKNRFDEYVEDDEENVTDCCIGCVWNICEPLSPTKIFYSRSDITVCSFHPTNCNIIFAGTEDGSINIWNLKEDSMWHRKVTDKVNEVDWTLRSPTFTTAGNTEIGHGSEIIGMTVLSKIDRDLVYVPSNKFSPVQICSLDANGRLIVWSLLRNTRKNIEDINSSLWGEIKLNKSQEITLNFKGVSVMKDFLRSFVHMEKDSVNINNLYLATNSTDVLHATCVGTKVSPTVYKNNLMELCGGNTCIEPCPFEQSYFFVGCNDGTIRLHSINIEKSLLQLKIKNQDAAVKMVQWSKSKPFCLFVLDELSQIHLWNLGSSDIVPMQTANATKKGRVKSMQLSPCNVIRDFIDQYLAIGTDAGNVEIHKLKQEYYYSQKEDIDRELNAFLQYVSIL